MPKIGIHLLSNIDDIAKTATCANCGPVKIYVAQRGGKAPQRICSLAALERAKERNLRLGLHAPRKPAPPYVPHPPLEHKPRGHALSEIDEEKKTAICRLCGPVKVYISKSIRNTRQVRCSSANQAAVKRTKSVRSEPKREYINNYKITQGCRRCGYNEHAFALDLHHRDQGEKDRKVSELTNASWDRLKAELEKCDVLCAICHRIEHREKGWA